MDYEKKYKDALAKAKEYFTPDTPERVDTKGCLVNIFPELVESEDERISHAIKGALTSQVSMDYLSALGVSLPDAIAWLEKQKDIITDYEDRLDRCACDNFNKGFKAGVEKQKEQKPIQETVNISGVEYVDLGLPSGTLWAKENIDGYYTWDEAKEKFGDSLPSPEQSNELYNNCEWEWSLKKKGFTVTGPNGNSIFLPATGYRNRGDGSLYYGSVGYYWLSATNSQESARDLSFSSGAVNPQSADYRAYGFSVRPCGVPQNF